MTLVFLTLALIALAATTVAARRAGAPTSGDRVHSRLLPTARALYTRRGFLRLGAGVAGAAVLVYAGADEAFDRWHRGNVSGSGADSGAGHLAHLFKEMGERYWVGVWWLFAVVDVHVASTALSRWGRTNFEAIATGLPTLWGLQYGLGASRPTDDNGPFYHPLRDQNSASGHTFIGAVPWLNLAPSIESAAMRTGLRLMSGATGWSRLYDRKHYLSQVLLGWGLAQSSVQAVRQVAPSSTRPARTDPVGP